MTDPVDPSNRQPGRLARTLMAAGFVRLPPLWVKESEFRVIKAAADRHLQTINMARERITRSAGKD